VRHTELCNLVQETAAIGLSPVVLAKAGILKGIKATVYPDDKAIDELKKNGAGYKNKDVITSGSIITARNPESAKKFAEEICSFLTK